MATKWSLHLVLLFLVIYKTQESGAELKMARLYNNILDNYDRNIRPVKNYSQAVTIDFSLKLNQLLEVNFDQGWVMASIIIGQEWMDYQLEWSPSSYDYITEIVLPGNRVWLPDITIYNNVEGILKVIPDSVRVHRSGRVTASTYAVVKFACNLDDSRFPFDEQSCFLKFGSWTFDGHKMDIRHKNQPPTNATIEHGIDLSEYYPNIEWRITNVSAIRHEKFYKCCKEPYPDLFFYFKIRRNSFSYMLTLILPWIIFTCLPLCAFCLPTNSNLKISYLVFLLILLLSSLAISGNSTNFPIFLMKKYYLFTTVVVTLSLLSCVVILNINSRKEESVSQIIRNVSKRLSEYVMLEWPDSGGEESSSSRVKEGTTAENIDGITEAPMIPPRKESDSAKIPEWEHIAHVMDRLGLIFFTVVCIIGIFIILI